MQSDVFNRSRLRTVLAVALTSNLRLVDAPGNVLVPKRASGLARNSVANLSKVLTLDREYLSARAGKLPQRLMAAVDAGFKLVLELP